LELQEQGMIETMNSWCAWNEEGQMKNEELS